MKPAPAPAGATLRPTPCHHNPAREGHRCGRLVFTENDELNKRGSSPNRFLFGADPPFLIVRARQEGVAVPYSISLARAGPELSNVGVQLAGKRTYSMERLDRAVGIDSRWLSGTS
jgi:hypothetical protein